jgi:hypothetical protein
MLPASPPAGSGYRRPTLRLPQPSWMLMGATNASPSVVAAGCFGDRRQEAPHPLRADRTSAGRSCRHRLLSGHLGPGPRAKSPIG